MMKSHSVQTQADFPLLVGSLSLAAMGISMAINYQWTLTQLFVSKAFDIAFPLASFLGLAYVALAAHGLMAYNANEPASFFQRKKDGLLVQSIFFAGHAFINLRCYSPLVGPAFSLITGEGKIFLWMAALNAVLAAWSFMTYSNMIPSRKTGATPTASQ